MKKQILFVLYNLEIGGAEKSLISMLNSIDYSLYDVDVFLYQHKGELINQLPHNVRLLPEIKVYATFDMSIQQTVKAGYWLIGGIRVAISLFSKLIGMKALYTQLMNGLTSKFLPSLEKKYDVAISCIWTHHFIVNNVKSEKKIGWIHTDYKQLNSIKWMDKQVMKKLDYIVSVSSNCKVSFDKAQPKLIDKSVVMENIISPSAMLSMANQSIHEEISEKEKVIRILTVARFHPDKGVDRAVEACKLLLNDGINVKWYVIGFGMQEPILKERIKELGIQDNFIILGKKDNPYPYFKLADLYVQPSRFEGKSIAITEAKVFSLPIIITDYPSAQDQIQSGHDGLIVENSVEGIFGGIKKLVIHPEEAKAYQEKSSEGSWNNEYEIHRLYQMIDN
ncbi:glycosyltransferase [Paenibacillus aceris]|uniref:Glycosyltransferase involved in cell wall biosynthesis n=1 Tax=Paenibacillus aceris TaxID=869555 RepID=A0ABS4I802_9BACL|nr:glycosyltransferase [Paenibacillus aceris]MBP1967060.1 glycosyltransferase involved in cell wall biosynthesis [Paenibacillus aceris]NHW33257.1 glycosyltransferase [Paenibacillus aceris]